MVIGADGKDDLNNAPSSQPSTAFPLLVASKEVKYTILKSRVVQIPFSPSASHKGGRPNPYMEIELMHGMEAEQLGMQSPKRVTTEGKALLLYAGHIRFSYGPACPCMKELLRLPYIETRPGRLTRALC